jgi:hypothetical protein
MDCATDCFEHSALERDSSVTFAPERDSSVTFAPERDSSVTFALRSRDALADPQR